MFRLFTLHSDIFTSFLENSLIARGISKKVIEFELHNWRENFGIGKYRQVDDRPFGGGTGMVIQADPIYKALQDFNAVSELFKVPEFEQYHQKILPNNSHFFTQIQDKKLHNKQNLNKKTLKATIMLTPRGYPVNQKTVKWLSEFDELNILCGRYEGFDSRVSEIVDLELSIGNFITNGGETPAMCLIESVSRLVPGFITKTESVNHDSFSSGLNFYKEQEEYVVGSNKLKQQKNITTVNDKLNLFQDSWWLKNVLPLIEHPQYTRPEVWQNFQVPSVLTQGNHKKIQEWRYNWWK